VYQKSIKYLDVLSFWELIVDQNWFFALKVPKGIIKGFDTVFICALYFMLQKCSWSLRIILVSLFRHQRIGEGALKHAINAMSIAGNSLTFMSQYLLKSVSVQFQAFSPFVKCLNKC
jgi:hypothetical protein